jgi:hypothetical protein
LELEIPQAEIGSLAIIAFLMRIPETLIPKSLGHPFRKCLDSFYFQSHLSKWHPLLSKVYHSVLSNVSLTRVEFAPDGKKPQ